MRQSVVDIARGSGVLSQTLERVVGTGCDKKRARSGTLGAEVNMDVSATCSISPSRPLSSGCLVLSVFS